MRLPRRFAPRKDRGEIVYNMWKNNFLKPLYNKAFRPHLK